GRGPGVGSYNAGSTHGGTGTWNTAATYGSISNPTSLGSGGNGSGVGGGAIVISSSGTVTVNGTLSAAGQSCTNSDGHSSAAGGTINITASTLTGTGTNQVNGGNEPAAPPN